MSRLLALLAACALMLSGCSRGPSQEVIAATPTPAPAATPAPTPAPTPTPTPTPVLLTPLTGLPLEDPGALTRPVAAVKIDNAPAARPPLGLNQADIVLEELVEGGVTRFIALYHGTDPGEVGPVRSGREVDADLLPAFQPVLGISGAARAAYQTLWAAGLLVFEEGQADGAFRRVTDRRAPHNLIADAGKLWAAGAELPAPEGPPWPIAATVPVGGEPANEVRLAFSPRTSAHWSWDADAGRWLRSQGDEPHRDAAGEQVSAATVVIAHVAVGAGGRTDSAGNRTVHIEVIGEGDALVLRDGRVFAVRWRKDAADAHFEWLTPDGDPLPLAPGRTWIELLPTRGDVQVE